MYDFTPHYFGPTALASVSYALVKESEALRVEDILIQLQRPVSKMGGYQSME